MKHLSKFQYVLAIFLLLVLIATASMPAAAVSSPDLDPGTQFYVPKVNHGAVEQMADLTSSGAKSDANLIKAMTQTPTAVWFTKGTPKTVLQDVRNTVSRAADKGTVPVLVAYNLPFRDCAQYSAGGATSVAEYKAWIDAFAAGIGSARAVVIVEPDGLGIIPFYNPYASADGSDGLEWCQPAEADPATAAAERFEMLNYAVDTLKANPGTSVYLDGTHSGWLGVGDAAHRLYQAGVLRADGFFLNVSNYMYSANLEQYGTWVSSCLTIASDPAGFNGCPNQYWNGGPLPADIAVRFGEWNGTAMDKFGEWSDDSPVMALNTSGINQRYLNSLAGVTPTVHFVIDTSRNGKGPWAPPAYPDAQDWCNPPDRGLGYRPTADTGSELLDAYLWVKVPGESDGECTRGLGPAGSTIDPEWGIVDPAAGQWFPEMALELAKNAVPTLP